MNDHDDGARPGTVSRRAFLGTAGVGALGAAIPEAGAAEAPVTQAGERVAVALEVNGVRHELSVEPRATLVGVLRDDLGLTGTKPGCERGECGACTVLIDGVPRYSCLTLAVEAAGRPVVTVEGLLRGEALAPVQEAFVAEDALQCGFCTPGQVLAAEGLLRANPAPTPDEIRRAMSGNLCRCGAYAHIFKAVARAAQARATSGGAR